MKIILDSWKLCQQHNKPTEIKDREMFDKTLEYIHLNPVMAGFVTKGKIGSIAVQEIFLFPITIARKD